jgi:hypothetical protein
MQHSTRPVRRESRKSRLCKSIWALASIAAAVALSSGTLAATQDCNKNSHSADDANTVRNRGDIIHLPSKLIDRLAALGGAPHTYFPLQIFAEAGTASQLFQYYLLDTSGFEPNVFTAVIPGVNETAMKTATGANCGEPAIGAVRLALEPKPGLPTSPDDPGAFIDVFTDIAGLFVINNESGWYEGWMIHDLVVPNVAPPRSDGHAKFGTMTAEDAAFLKKMGDGNNVPGNHVPTLFTIDGKRPHSPSAHDRFPDVQTNLVPIQLSMGAYNCLQQSDCHSYWEFNYQTNWIHPLYELPVTGGFPDRFGAAPDALQDGEIGKRQSIVPGSGPLGVHNDPRTYGDSPDRPRDPDLFDADIESQREFRQRFIPSGLANEILLDVYVRRASFMPHEHSLNRRLYQAYAEEVRRVDTNHDGVISAAEGDIDTGSDGFPDNSRLFLPATSFNRFAVTREINDGLLAPRFAPSQRAWVLQGVIAPVRPAVPASLDRDIDDR